MNINATISLDIQYVLIYVAMHVATLSYFESD